jgi:D-amino peptidase
MKVFISVDMEGTSGLERLEEIFRGLPGFDQFRKLMAGDANAVIRGAIAGGADEVVVSDSHGYMCNIYPDDLLPGVQLKRGMRRQWCQMKGLDSSFDLALLVGYHAKAGSTDAILAHTWITGFRDVRVNGMSVPEPSLNTYLAGAFGVPVGMLSGDDYVIREAAPVLGDDVEYAQVKQSTGFFSGDHLPLPESRRLLAETARRAIQTATGRKPVECELPVTIEVDLSPDPVDDAALAARVDDNQRFIDRPWEHEHLSDVELVLATHPHTTSPSRGTVAFESDNYPDAYQTLHSILLEIYERDIENLIDVVARPADYARPDLDELISGHSVTETDVETTHTGVH